MVRRLVVPMVQQLRLAAVQQELSAAAPGAKVAVA